MIKYIPVMHYWGEWTDEGFADVDRAAHEIAKFCRRWGRFTGQAKEKFGQVRFYAYIGGRLDLYSLWNGGYFYYRGPNWFWKLNCFIAKRVSVPFNLLEHYRVFIYKLAYKRALKRYPHIHNEIISGMDHKELLGAAALEWDDLSGDEDEV